MEIESAQCASDGDWGGGGRGDFHLIVFRCAQQTEVGLQAQRRVQPRCCSAEKETGCCPIKPLQEQVAVVLDLIVLQTQIVRDTDGFLGGEGCEGDGVGQCTVRAMVIGGGRGGWEGQFSPENVPICGNNTGWVA